MSLVPQNSFLNFERKIGSPFEILRNLFIKCMSAVDFNPKIGEVSVFATIIGTSYILFLCGICTAHFPSTGTELTL